MLVKQSFDKEKYYSVWLTGSHKLPAFNPITRTSSLCLKFNSEELNWNVVITTCYNPTIEHLGIIPLEINSIFMRNNQPKNKKCKKLSYCKGLPKNLHNCFLDMLWYKKVEQARFDKHNITMGGGWCGGLNV